MPGPSDTSYGQQPAPSAMPRCPSPTAGFSQPPANQGMMPGFPQPYSGDASSSNYPVVAPAPVSYSQPVPAFSVPQQPAGECLESHLIHVGLTLIDDSGKGAVLLMSRNGNTLTQIQQSRKLVMVIVLSNKLVCIAVCHSFIHQGRRLAIGSLSTCLSAYRQR